MAKSKDTPEEIHRKVRDGAFQIVTMFAKNGVSFDIGMASMAMVLATAAKEKGLTQHEAISRFTHSVYLIYKDHNDG